MTLDTLLTRAQVNRYHEHQWFRGAQLHANQLLIDGDAQHLAFVERNWGSALREALPDVEIRRLVHAPKPVKAATKFPAIKPGPWRDLLDFGPKQGS